MTRRVLTVLAVVIAVFDLVVGIWPFVAPRSFFDAVATFEPYNEHFLHDVGAFTTGLGAVILAGLIWRQGLFVALVGNAVAAVLHAIAHIRDRDLGGQATDPVFLSLFAAVVVIAMLLALDRRSDRMKFSARR